MINTFFSAKLIDFNTIKVGFFSSIGKADNVPIILYDDHGLVEKLQITNQSFLSGLVVYECKTKDKIKLGRDYSIGIESFGIVPLNVNDLVFSSEFDKVYYYDKNDLGATYTKDETTFKVWAPLASKVVLMIKKPGESFQTYKMLREEKGVYAITLKGDYDGYFYRYQVKNSAITYITSDPYGLSSDANGKNSVVIDLNKTKIDLNENVPPIYKNYVDTIIYELNVRDFTISQYSNIKNRGKFLGLTEEGVKTNSGLPSGVDYLKSLNITHVQLLPVLDFKTVDEEHPDKTYNWGYDPQQYFTLEGSYSTNPNDPYARIIEFKKMISTLHKNGLRVNLDVVYNHVYEYQMSTFEKIVPNYYFRRQKNGLLCNGTGCGNDLASERPMVKKLIIDSLSYLLKEFKVDGFRFDLFGIIDIDTSKEIVASLRKINPNVMIYGEGWDMPTELPHDKKTTIYNSFQVPDIAFFNDFFRDTVRGGNFGGPKGYLLGNTSLVNDFKFCLMGSVVDYDHFKARFKNPNQSINYAECHDNKTLFDKISEFCRDIDEKEKLRILNLVNGGIALSVGVPFFHAGQEIGQTKYNIDNSYNLGDKYNMFRWDLLEERVENYLYFKSILDYRKNVVTNKIYNTEDVKKETMFLDYHDGTIGFIIHNIETSNATIEEYLSCFNPTFENKYIDLNDYYKVVVGIAGQLKNSDVYTRNFVLEKNCVNGFYKKR